MRGETPTYGAWILNTYRSPHSESDQELRADDTRGDAQMIRFDSDGLPPPMTTDVRTREIDGASHTRSEQSKPVESGNTPSDSTLEVV
jgi:hypothetical protein